MEIIVNLDKVLADRNMKSKELAEAIGITEANLSILKSGCKSSQIFNIRDHL